MFRCFKILLQLSREENILERLESRYAEAEKKLEEFVQKVQTDFDSFKRISEEIETQLHKVEELNQSVTKMSEALEQRINEDKTALQNIAVELEKCEKQVLAKLDGIQKSAEQYVAKIHTEIESYETNVSTLGKRMEALKEAVSEFQR